MRNLSRVRSILAVLFDGKIPIDRLDELPGIEADITALIAKARGRDGALVTTARGTHRRTGPSSEESARITARVIELRGEGPRRGGLLWSEIAAVLTNEGMVGQNGRAITKDSCRHRFTEARKPANLSAPQQIHEILKVEEINAVPEAAILVEKVKDGKPLCAMCGGKIGVAAVGQRGKIYCSGKCAGIEPKPAKDGEEPAPMSSPSAEELDQIIYGLRDQGMKLEQIAEVLKGEHDLTMLPKEINYRLIARGRQKRQAAKSEAAKNAAEKAATKPQIDFDAAVDSKIITMKKRDLPDIDIAQALERNPGGRWSGPKVAARYAELQKEGMTG
jgi:DNA-binding transcriptional MerR regulator